ncbi:MAG: patatin-like phospholipase family protein [Herpetosiphonaceae bacterium]|nr:patatin-like phospholipase family protein [Herpetosiphonaceae bacterium]
MKKALVLSGGGGRGAYHVGVMQALVERGWMADGQGPDIIAGTSIGAVNAGAIASGMTIADLEQRWKHMHSEDVHRLSNDMPAISRPLMRFILRSILTSKAGGGEEQIEDELPEADRQLGSVDLFSRLRGIFHITPFRSLLDTTPWRQTLSRWMDFKRINSPAAPTLLLTATDVRRGTLKVFCNHEPSGTIRDTLTIDHIMASSSIPAIYPWTKVEENFYWDGAVLANTPLGPIIEHAGGDVDIIVVMMTPWDADPEDLEEQLEDMPKDLAQALWLTLDWALLASYRASFKLLKLYNRIADAAQKLEQAASQTGDASLRWQGRMPHRVPEPLVIAPKHLMPLEWIVDYESDNHDRLFDMGYYDAIAALDKRENDAMLRELLT